MKKTILITGGTGLIGSHVINELCRQGAFVKVLTTNIDNARKVLRKDFTAQFFDWDEYDSPFSLATLMEDVDVIINLAGENVGASRWTGEFKDKIYNSRIQTTKLLVEAIRTSKRQPAVLLSSSAVGYYGFRGDEILTEDSGPGDDFLAKVCRDWETEALKAISSNVRVVTIRTGIVLDKDDGALKQMLAPFRFSVGVYQGNGRQWFSWIHIKDIVRLFLYAMENENVFGALNGDTPNPVTNKELIKTAGEILGKNLIVPVPGFILKIAVGEFADNLLTGQRVSPSKAIELGFKFDYPELKPALQNLLKEN